VLLLEVAHEDVAILFLGAVVRLSVAVGSVLLDVLVLLLEVGNEDVTILFAGAVSTLSIAVGSVLLDVLVLLLEVLHEDVAILFAGAVGTLSIAVFSGLLDALVLLLEVGNEHITILFTFVSSSSGPSSVARALAVAAKAAKATIAGLSIARVETTCLSLDTTEVEGKAVSEATLEALLRAT